MGLRMIFLLNLFIVLVCFCKKIDMYKIKPLYFTFLLICFFSLIGNAQTKKLPDDVQLQIDNFKTQAIKNRNAGNDNAAAGYLNKIAYLYWEYFMYNESIANFQEVLVINQNLGNSNGEQKVFDNIGFVYSDMQRYDLAIESFKKSLNILTQKDNKADIANCLSNIAIAYNSNGQPKEAIEMALKGLELAQNLNNIKLMRSIYGTLHESYDKLGDKDKSMEYFNLYSSIDKHIQQELFQEKEKQNQQQLVQMESEKKEAISQKEAKESELKQTRDTLTEVELISRDQQLNLEVQQLTINQQKMQLKTQRQRLVFILGILIIIILFAIYVFYQMREKRKANLKLQDLNREIEKKNQQILDSINYASHIQEAILPFEKSIQVDIPDSFVLFKPRDIVSGDFYWHSKHDHLIFIAAIDCTGHGVPGAFMSMIGNTLLNEIVDVMHIFKPSEVLKCLNEKVIFTLNQNASDISGFSEDGMDISFCCYNIKDQTLELALANHTACLVQNNEVVPIEGDIYSVGGNVAIQSGVSYTDQLIKLDKPTSIYMFSDGFQDQFGGNIRQKYFTKRFYSFLQSIQSLPFLTTERCFT